jgi:glycosyltransferase involved in cell wall biosynthesis
MTALNRLRRLGRALPIGSTLRRRLRLCTGLGFQLLAWLRHGRSRRPAPPRPGPVCVVGLHGSVLGVGEAARAMSDALRLAGAEVSDWDVSALFGHEARLDRQGSTEPPSHASSLVMFLNPHELVQLIALKGAQPFAGRRCIGCWAWELEQVPPSWRGALRYLDEVWAPSRFVRDAVLAAEPSAAVRIAPHPVAAHKAEPDRDAFGLPEDKVVVLTAFDARSGFNRKNPIAAVRAFRQANADGQALMVCKAVGVDSAPALMAGLRDEIGGGGDVRLMTDWLSGAQMASLIASADIVLSLHRSEGFGLLPAQAMAQGKAVLATGWSANLDFMTPDNSELVAYTLVPVADSQGLYAGGRWAEPDIDDAAARLRALIADPDRRRALGERAAGDIAAALSPQTIGARARAWLEGREA